LVAALLLSLENNNNAMKEIKLLEEQIDKLKLKDFDLEAWKQYTIVLLARIFGDNNQKIQQIEKIEYDYSSWALRDTSGKSSYLDTCKKLGKEILMASIDELNAFGVPDKNVKSEYSVSKEVISLALENELKVSQFKELVALINEDWDIDKKKSAIQKKLESYGKTSFAHILSDILSHPDLKGKL
jgi:hypothetical protein